MTEHYRRIREFHIGGKLKVRDKPEMGTLEERILRAKLILEETFEAVHEGLGLKTLIGDEFDFEDIRLEHAREPDLVAFVDGCADISVVIIGSLVQFGVDDGPVLELVDKNNLKKLVGCTWNEFGKLIKPPGHEKPDFGELIRQLGREEVEIGDLIRSPQIPAGYPGGYGGLGIVRQRQFSESKITGDPEKIKARNLKDSPRQIVTVTAEDEFGKEFTCTEWKLVKKNFVIQGIKFGIMVQENLEKDTSDEQPQRSSGELGQDGFGTAGSPDSGIGGRRGSSGGSGPEGPGSGDCVWRKVGERSGNRGLWSYLKSKIGISD